MAEAYDATEVEDESLASVVDEEKEDVAILPKIVPVLDPITLTLRPT